MYNIAICFAISSVFALSFAAPHHLDAPTSESLAGRDGYVMFGGDGSMAAGWPKRSEWMSFDKAWDANLKIIQTSCGWNSWGANNDETETKAIKASIEKESNATGIPREFILAVIVQESKGCVRVPTTQAYTANPGLMQSSGLASCNPDALGKAPITPCPNTTISAMIHDGTAGEGLSMTLKTCLDFFDPMNSTDDSKWYKAARRYNAGPSVDVDNLGFGPTPCYASDIANRLTQPFVETKCSGSIIATLTRAQGRVTVNNDNNNDNNEQIKEAENKGPVPNTQHLHLAPALPKDGALAKDTRGGGMKSNDPVIAGAAEGCTEFFTPKKGDTCVSAPITFAELRELNSQLNDVCTNLWAGYQYCVAV